MVGGDSGGGRGAGVLEALESLESLGSLGALGSLGVLGCRNSGGGRGAGRDGDANKLAIWGRSRWSLAGDADLWSAIWGALGVFRLWEL